MTEPGSDHGMFSPGNDAGIDPAYTDEQILRDALLLLRKFASEPSQWPDGPKAFPGAVDQAEEALGRILDEVRRTRFQADNMIVVPEDRALRAEAEHAALLRWTDEAHALLSASARCPIHGIPDCSPLLNGCSFPNRRAALLAAHDAVTGGH